MDDYEEKFVITQCKIGIPSVDLLGSVNPEDFTFAEIYKLIHAFSKSLDELRKSTTELEHGNHDESTLRYYKEELNRKAEILKIKLEEIEKAINIFIELYYFHQQKKGQSLKLQKRNSMKRLSKSKLSAIDPLLGDTPQSFEDEKKMLEEKHKGLKQKFLSLVKTLNTERPDAFLTEREGIYKKIDEATQIAKANKKKISDTQGKFEKVFSH